MNAFRSLAAVAVFMLATLVPAAAIVGTPGSKPVTYSTALTPDWRGVGAFEGRLTLTISPDGIVSGFYRPADGTRLSDVTGGLDGNRIWLDLGQGGLSHIDGTYDGRTINGGIYVSGQDYTFTATPEAQ
jgi:hypothetical protein